MATKRQQIINAVDTKFKTIKQVNGYNTDLGLNVFPWRGTAMSDTERPALCYEDIRNTREKVEAIGSFRWRLTVKVRLYAAAGSNIAEEIRKMMEDCYKAIGLDPTWGGLACITEQHLDKTYAKSQDNTLGEGYFKIYIIYDTPKWQI